MTQIKRLEVVRDANLTVAAQYDALIRDVIRKLWLWKPWVGLAILGALASATVSLKYIGPSYTSEAIIQLDFNQNGPEAGGRSVALEASALVDSAVRILRARSTAEAVVNQLQLDQNPRSQARSLPSQLLARFRAFLGVSDLPSSPHERAVSAVMRQVRVTSDPRSYVIVISATSKDPEQAAELANAAAVQFLQEAALERTKAARAAAERELATLALTYGARHYKYIQAQHQLEQLKARLDAMLNKKTSADPDVLQSLIPAYPIFEPSGPNIPVVFAAATAGTLIFCLWLSWLSVRSSNRSATDFKVNQEKIFGERNIEFGLRESD
jgi:uncharacterized protein involved in exopolysaccharide biosynthesis